LFLQIHKYIGIKIPVSGSGILDSERLELLVHLLVEVLAQEEGPETEHGVHLLGLTHA
jgi:hypothetical protein